MINQYHRLDVIPGGPIVVVHVKQYQTDEDLIFNLYSRLGDLNISASYTDCTIRGTKSDGNGYSASATCDTVNKRVTVQLTQQMTAVAGRQPYEITITDNTGKMITATFILDVQRAALDDDTVVSDSVIREIEESVQEQVADYISDHPGLFIVDDTLTQSGEAADAKKTGDEISDLKSAVEALETGGGLTADVKSALLGCFENVAWIGDDGQDYYDALDPHAGLVSISAVYTQSGTVYDTDTLSSLKSDLVVTALYDDTTTETVSTYTLSGTLTVGISTITVSYGGKTTTFTVTVTDGTDYLYNWDFTQSLTDRVASREAVLSAASGSSNASRDSSGLHFNAATQIVYLGEINLSGKTVEIDVASFDFNGNSSKHVRFFMCSNASSGSGAYGNGALIYRNTGIWSTYGFTQLGGQSRSWADYSELTNVNIFNGKTVKIVFDSDGHTKKVYSDDELVGTNATIYFNNTQGTSDIAKYIYIGGIISDSSPSEANGDQCYDMTITGVRVYETV